MGKITVVFNNAQGDGALKTGWGSSLLIEDAGKSILYDTGPDAEKLFSNLKTLGRDISGIGNIAISHGHKDHTGALAEILRANLKGIELYVPASFGEKELSMLGYLARDAYIAEQKREIEKNIYLVTVKGRFSVEGVLVIDSPGGLIILTGCAHPGVYRICHFVKGDFKKNIYALLGGFHLEHYPLFAVKILGHRLKGLGIEILGPNHCTGEKATAALRAIFKEGFADFGSGSVFEY